MISSGRAGLAGARRRGWPRPPRRTGTTAHRCGAGGRRGSGRASARRAFSNRGNTWMGRSSPRSSSASVVAPPVVAEQAAAGRCPAAARSRPAPAGRGAGGPPPGCRRSRRPTSTATSSSPRPMARDGGVDQALGVVATGGGHQHLGRAPSPAPRPPAARGCSSASSTGWPPAATGPGRSQPPPGRGRPTGRCPVAVLDGGPDGLDHQADRLGALVEPDLALGVGPVGDLADPHDDRGGGVERS